MMPFYRVLNFFGMVPYYRVPAYIAYILHYSSSTIMANITYLPSLEWKLKITKLYESKADPLEIAQNVF